MQHRHAAVRGLFASTESLGFPRLFREKATPQPLFRSQNHRWTNASEWMLQKSRGLWLRTSKWWWCLGDSEASNAFLKGTCRLGVVMRTSWGGEHKRSIRTVHSYLRKVNSMGMDEEIRIKYV